MSAYAFSATFNGMLPAPPLSTTSATATKASESVIADNGGDSAPKPSPGTVLPPIKLVECRGDSDRAVGRFGGCPGTPSRRGRKIAESDPPTSRDNNIEEVQASDPSIVARWVVLNAHLLAVSPRSAVRQGTGGNLHSPRRQSRHVGQNGILDAIEVDLVVTRSGRTYTATRALARIVEMASDLIAETSTSNDATVIVPVLPSEIKRMTASAPVPRSGSVFLLQDRLDAVRDILNDWFCRLLNAVNISNSLVLSSFLWEPMWRTDGSGFGQRISPNRSTSSSSRDLALASSTCSTESADERANDTPRKYMTNSLRNEDVPLAFCRRTSSVKRRGSSVRDSLSTVGSIDPSLLF
mmetsp:Transcript_18062/g.39465  ORF Transcript_18062/g.39465 Transcript_18062/m.39465 type:complete len:353 (-) Transcript_18062:4308-5366(-)